MIDTVSQRPSLDPIFIVGQYKCGTTWLLSLLSAHPQAFGVDELNIINAASEREGTGVRFRSVEDRLRRFFVTNAWASILDGAEWRNLLPELEQGRPIRTVPWKRSSPQKIYNLSAPVAATLYERIKGAKRPEEAMDSFLEAVCADAPGASRVVLKSSNQEWAVDLLKAWRPQAKKVAITRDGRDAAISGYQYEKWVKEKNAPYGAKDNDYWTLLRQWAERADLIVKWAHRGELYVIRYEDLSRDFAGTFKPLLVWLGLDPSDALVESINAQTSFQATTGRARGVEAKSFRRKGSIREWVEVLSTEDKAKAWALAGKQLSAFGYTADGELLPFSHPPY